jgi:hypothetical protein
MFFSDNGINILNISSGAITYDTDLQALVSHLFKVQASNNEKYGELASKSIFMVSQEDYQACVSFYEGGGAKKKKMANNKNQETSSPGRAAVYLRSVPR